MNDKKANWTDRAKDFGRGMAEKAKKAGSDAIRFAENNKEVLVAAIPLAIAAVKAMQTASVSHRMNTERKRIDQTYYDPSTGFHWELRRKATNADRAEILRRKGAGQDTYTILKQMGLIR